MLMTVNQSIPLPIGVTSYLEIRVGLLLKFPFLPRVPFPLGNLAHMEFPSIWKLDLCPLFTGYLPITSSFPSRTFQNASSILPLSCSANQPGTLTWCHQVIYMLGLYCFTLMWCPCTSHVLRICSGLSLPVRENFSSTIPKMNERCISKPRNVVVFLCTWTWELDDTVR